MVVVALAIIAPWDREAPGPDAAVAERTEQFAAQLEQPDVLRELVYLLMLLGETTKPGSINVAQKAATTETGSIHVAAATEAEAT